MAQQRDSIMERSKRHLRQARAAVGLTQGETAEAASLEEGTYGAYERAKSLVTSEALIKLRRVLHQTTDYLLGFEDPADLSVEERLLVDYFRQTRNPGIRQSILNHARVQQDIDRSLPNPEATPAQPARVRSPQNG